MAAQIFVNLPVENLDQSKEFYTAIGFKVNPQFTDNTAACIVISEHIYVMILTKEKFKEFTPKPIADATRTTEVINALSFESKEQVNEIAEKAIQAGGSEARPLIDYGFMYARSFNDLDGHIWEAFWMDMNAAPPEPTV